MHFSMKIFFKTLIVLFYYAIQRLLQYQYISFYANCAIFLIQDRLSILSILELNLHIFA